MLPTLAYFAIPRLGFVRHAARTAGAGLPILAIAAATASASAAPLDPSGYWNDKDQASIIRISPCATPPAYCGTVVWLKEPLDKGMPQTDTNNPDPAKRSRPILGMDVFSELIAEDDHWKGKAYNSDDGKTYDITFKVFPDKVNGDKGEITGCVLRILCKSETFTKVQAVPGGDPTLPAAPAAVNAPHAAPAKPAASSAHH